MKYLFAVLLPPLAVLMCGKPIQAIINFFLCFLIWIPGVVHAIFIVNSSENEKRHRELIETLKAKNN